MTRQAQIHFDAPLSPPLAQGWIKVIVIEKRVMPECKQLGIKAMRLWAAQ
jgi:hypothetical protein